MNNAIRKEECIDTTNTTYLLRSERCIRLQLWPQIHQFIAKQLVKARRQFLQKHFERCSDWLGRCAVMEKHCLHHLGLGRDHGNRSDCVLQRFVFITAIMKIRAHTHTHTHMRARLVCTVNCMGPLLGRRSSASFGSFVPIVGLKCTCITSTVNHTGRTQHEPVVRVSIVERSLMLLRCAALYLLRQSRAQTG